MCLAWQPVFRFRYVYDMHSSLPRQLSNFSYSKSPLLTDLFEILERKALSRADAVITVCPDLFEYARGLGTDASRLILIENSLFDPVSVVRGAEAVETDAEFNEDLPPDRRLVFYAGTLEPYQGISLLLQAFSRVAQQLENVDLIVAGGTARQVDGYRREAAALGLKTRCRFMGSVPRHRAMSLSKRSSVLVSTRTTGTNVPLKIYEHLASGIPLVATDVYAHTQVLSEEVAFLAPPDPDTLAGALVRALTDPVEGDRRTGRARALYAARYDAAAYREKMRTLLGWLS
jgi:glycosyltransferase involved in cell wall biosynthesis